MRLAETHMADCVAGRGPSNSASDHMLGYVDNDAERRILLDELNRRNMACKYVSVATAACDTETVKIDEPGVQANNRYIEMTVDEARRVLRELALVITAVDAKHGRIA